MVGLVEQFQGKIIVIQLRQSDGYINGTKILIKTHLNCFTHCLNINSLATHVIPEYYEATESLFVFFKLINYYVFLS